MGYAIFHMQEGRRVVSGEGGQSRLRELEDGGAHANKRTSGHLSSDCRGRRRGFQRRMWWGRSGCWTRGPNVYLLSPALRVWRLHLRVTPVIPEASRFFNFSALLTHSQENTTP